MRLRSVDKEGVALAALRLPFGAPQRQLGFLPDFSWTVVWSLLPVPPPSPQSRVVDSVGTGGTVRRGAFAFIPTIYDAPQAWG